jgi:hypothetical protein
MGGKMSANNWWIKIGAAAAVLLLAACSTINSKHPQLMMDGLTAEQTASVYFIRPTAYKTKQISNGPVRITFQGQTLLAQDEGNYSLLHIKPSKGALRIYSMTRFTDKLEAVEVWRERQYKFIAGRTYFVHVRQINEEFRGVFYEPQPVNLREAKQLIVPGTGRFGNTDPSGAARSEPIDELTEVNAPPASAVKSLAPALPENIYRQEKYLPKSDKF